MAKKVVATLKTGDGRGYAKVIKMVKSPKSGAYMFKEQMVIRGYERIDFSVLFFYRFFGKEICNTLKGNDWLYQSFLVAGARLERTTFGL